MTEPTTHRVQLEVAGRHLTFETGWLARQAGGAVTVRYGDSLVLVTATASEQPREGIDFFPLTCDFEEKMYAAGKIPGGFFKREGRPGEHAIHSARLIDRPIRPLFPKGVRNDVQVIATVLSADMENDPAILAINGASAALAISNVPFDGPIGAVRIGMVGDALTVNPRQADRDSSRLDLVVAATEDAIIMIDAGADEVPEDRILEALDLAHAEIRKIIGVQRELARVAGKTKTTFTAPVADEELTRQVHSQAQPLIRAALAQPEKLMREDALRQVALGVAPFLADAHPGREKEIEEVIQGAIKDEVRRSILQDGRRPDGRGIGDIRPLSATVGLLPRAHGSGLFQRGQTQVLTVATLGTGEDEQIIDDLTPRERKRFMHHYNFPPFSVGEVRPLRSAGRREIGHGLLAERALEPVVPDETVFPYTIRLVSETLESNGSTSMASVCGSTLALMDAGVPIKAPVAGISIGLITGDGGRFALLTDIQGIEDAMGDMDFKVAGTRAGVTAVQLDIKVKGLTHEMVTGAMTQAREARLRILDVIAQALPAPRAHLSPYAPRIITIEINPEKIREVIGPGGKVINKITAETGVKIDIEQDGRVNVASADEDAARRAIKMIEDIVREVKVGEIYTGRVTRLMNFGAFVEVLPGKEGLLHVSELGDGERVERVEDAVKVGDEVTVRVREIDNLGRVNLTRRLTPGPEDEAAREAARARGRQGPRSGGRGRDDGRPRRRGPRPDSHGPRS
jgi:polyribonucleotide nucleotidyltransferase